MRFKVKVVNIATKGPLIAILNHEDATFLDLQALDRIKIKKGSKEIIAAVDISYSKKDINKSEIGLFLDIIEKLNLKNKEFIDICVEPKPKSLEFIKKKLDNNPLNKEEIDSIIKDLVENKLTEVETTYFISACYINKMSLDESVYLTEAISKNGGKLKFDKKFVVDKHCSGGVPNNRTTPIIVPIIAAAGLTMPKTSTRSITSPAGTADCVEILAPVSHSKEEIMKIVKKTNACMVWGGTLDLASADDKLIKLERILDLDPEGILLASILAKKSAVDSSHILIDIPIGKETKIKDVKQGRKLAKKFIKIGKKLGMKIRVILTDGSHPIGNGIGPALEARDVLLILQNRGPLDLKNKAVCMAGIILDMVGIKNSQKKALEILESGLAYKKMQEIIKAQGGNPNIQPEEIQIGKFKHEVKAKKSGKVNYISNNKISRIAKIAGAPFDKGAGIDLFVKIKSEVNHNSVLYTIHAENKEKLIEAIKEELDKAVIID